MTTREIRFRKRSTPTTDIAPTQAPPCNSVAPELRLVIDYVDPGSLIPPTRKLRKEKQRQQAQMEASITHFGFNNPVLIDGDRRIVCGHARWLATRELGMREVPVISVTHLSPELLRLYAIAENQIGLLGEWDEVELTIELKELLDLNLDLNLELTGFTTCEIDKLLYAPPAPEHGGKVDGALESSAVTGRGDLWQLGEHRLLCGDALEEASYQVLLGEERAQMVFADVPYNVPMSMISGKGRAKHKDFAIGSGEMTREQFTDFMATAFGWMAAYSVDGSIHFQCIDWRHLLKMQQAGERAYTELKNVIVWDNGSGGMGSFYRSQHEIIFAWK